MMTGSMFRWRTKEKEYNNHKKSNKSKSCDFCQLVKHHTDQVVGETAHCLIIKNRFGYNFWDGYGVDDHLMVIPKRHVDSLANLKDEEKIDYINQVARFESGGYSIYARAQGSKTKSMAHQHTHLIKIDGKTKKWLVFLQKPHIVITG